MRKQGMGHWCLVKLKGDEINVFLKPVEARSEDVLIKFIREKVLLRTTIVSNF